MVQIIAKQKLNKLVRSNLKLYIIDKSRWAIKSCVVLGIKNKSLIIKHSLFDNDFSVMKISLTA